MSINSWLWRSYAKVYDGLLNFWPYQNMLNITLAALEVPASGALLDAGCGTGNLLNRVAGKGLELTGVDSSSGMLKVAKQKLGNTSIHLIKSDLLEFAKQQPSQVYDRVVSINVLYAVPEPSLVVTEMVRSLKPGGRIVITTATHTGNSAIIREHVKNASAWKLLRPRLIGVFLFDVLIDVFGRTRRFPFPSEDKLRRWITESGCIVDSISRCYGGVAVVISAHRPEQL